MSRIDLSRLTASQASLARHCAWSLRFDAPRAPDAPTTASKRGNAVHSILHHYLTDEEWMGVDHEVRKAIEREHLRPAQSLHVVTAKSQLLIGWVDKFRRMFEPTLIGSELAYAWDPETDKAASIGVNLGRDYGAYATTNLCGTADAVFVERRGDANRLVLIDWKTGRRETCVNPGQILALSSLAWSALRTQHMLVDEVKYYTVCASDAGLYVPAPHLVTLADMDAFKVDMRRILDADTHEQVPGDHCAGCRAKHACAAYVKPRWPVYKSGMGCVTLGARTL